MSVNSYADALSSNLVLNGTEKANIKKSINALGAKLGSYFDDIEEMLLFGSYTRGTILPRKADSNSDIDLMIVFRNDEDLKPQTYLNRLRKFVERYYSKSEIYQSSPTIVLNLNHIKFELVPAYKSSFFWVKEYNIPAPKSDYYDWMKTAPNNFNTKLTEKNKTENSRIKPMVRLAKYWNASQKGIYASYALEEYIVGLNYDYYSKSTYDYFSDFALSLQTYHLNGTAKSKVEKLQNSVREINRLKSSGNEYAAENKLKMLLPQL